MNYFVKFNFKVSEKSKTTSLLNLCIELLFFDLVFKTHIISSLVNMSKIAAKMRNTQTHEWDIPEIIFFIFMNYFSRFNFKVSENACLHLTPLENILRFIIIEIYVRNIVINEKIKNKQKTFNEIMCQVASLYPKIPQLGSLVWVAHIKSNWAFACKLNMGSIFLVSKCFKCSEISRIRTPRWVFPLWVQQCVNIVRREYCLVCRLSLIETVFPYFCDGFMFLAKVRFSDYWLYLLCFDKNNGRPRFHLLHTTYNIYR